MITTDARAVANHQAWQESAGVETLRRMASIEHYNEWIFRVLKRHMGRAILEVGCGIGNMTGFFANAERLTCVDVLPESLVEVRRQFAHAPHIQVLEADIADHSAVERIGRGLHDTVVCINVLEHIEQDAAALRHMWQTLRPGGKLLLFIPAGQYLFGALDEALGHYRRYELQSLRALVSAQGFNIVDAYYMNPAGVPGWFVSSRVLRRTVPPRGLLRLFNTLTPALVWLEERWRPPIGLSIVCVAQRPLDAS